SQTTSTGASRTTSTDTTVRGRDRSGTVLGTVVVRGAPVAGTGGRLTARSGSGAEAAVGLLKRDDQRAADQELALVDLVDLLLLGRCRGRLRLLGLLRLVQPLGLLGVLGSGLGRLVCRGLERLNGPVGRRRLVGRGRRGAP